MRRIGGDEDVSRAVELRERLALEREGSSFLVLRDGADRQRLLVLEAADCRLVIGREPACDIVLAWDRQVSRTHAQLERAGDEWLIVDDGVSTNGTFVDGERLVGCHRLRDGDAVRCAGTPLTYRRCAAREVPPTSTGPSPPGTQDISPAQRRVLVALCGPCLGDETRVAPATNREIAAELVLSTEAVKTHLRALYTRFALEQLPQNQKRLQLAAGAIRAGIVSARDASR